MKKIDTKFSVARITCIPTGNVITEVTTCNTPQEYGHVVWYMAKREYSTEHPIFDDCRNPAYPRNKEFFKEEFIATYPSEDRLKEFAEENKGKAEELLRSLTK
ncbi:hypothetical protein CEW46_28670 [Bacillus cereus]|nr:hypothetical protein CEW46_28670 [Bacillus cereus]